MTIGNDQKIANLHPLALYLIQAGETHSSFAERVCIRTENLEAILSWREEPDLPLIRRIIDESDKYLNIDDFFYKNQPDSPDIHLNAPNQQNLPDSQIANLADFRVLHGDEALNIEVLKEIFYISFNDMKTEANMSDMPDTEQENLYLQGAHAAASTYDALARISSRQSPSRLPQALRPVVEQILEASQAYPHNPNHVEIVTTRCANLYERYQQLAPYKNTQ